MTPPAPITGSAMKAATGSGPSRRISSSRSRANPGGDCPLAAPGGLGKAVVMRAGGVEDVPDRQVEVGMDGRQAGQRARGDGYAVIALDPRDDLLLLMAATGVVVVPGQLD